jgi:hypothetical protein
MACTSALSYEVATHAKITNAAFSQSKLNGAEWLQQKALGIEVWTLAVPLRPFDTSNGSLYFDFSGGQIFARSVRDYESDVMGSIVLRNDALALNGWLMRGAIREDDGDLAVAMLYGQPRDDPFGNMNRFCNHFLDPTTGLGYSDICPLPSPVLNAAQWTLGSLTPFDTAPVELAGRRNHFTALDAREAMWRALTLRDGTGSPVPQTVGQISFTPEELRKVYWATTFRALGDVLHTVQDMGQPQHTRDEGHALQPQGYEAYIDARARREPEFKIDGLTLSSALGQLPDLTYLEDPPYPPPRFSRYSDYWSSRLRQSPNYYGLADYSNRGFFTLKNNVGNTRYPLPSPNASSYAPVRSEATYFGKSVNLLMGSVPDDVTNTPSPPISMAIEGIFTGVTPVEGPVGSGYGLSYRNYDDRAALLIPRAVAYSTGLLDFFFRGKLEISLPDDGIYGVVDHSTFNPTNPSTGFRKIKLRLANTTPAIGPEAQHMTGGRLVAVLKYRRIKTAYAPDLTAECGAGQIPVGDCRDDVEQILVSSSVTNPDGTPVNDATLTADGPAKEFHFNFDEGLPLNVTDLYLQVAYRGALGSESDAVVVQTKDIPEPTYFTVFNASDSLLCVNGTWYALNSDGTLPDGPGKQWIVDNNYIIPFKLTSSIVGISFKEPFPAPAWIFNPVASVANLKPAEFVRLTVLADDDIEHLSQTRWVADMNEFELHDPANLGTQRVGVSYPGAIVQNGLATKSLRGTNHLIYVFAHRFVGNQCMGTNFPTSPTAADSQPYPPPVQRPVVIAF